MELFANLALGFDTAMSLQNLAYCLAGVFLGTAVGVLPGLGPVAVSYTHLTLPTNREV